MWRSRLQRRLHLPARPNDRAGYPQDGCGILSDHRARQAVCPASAALERHRLEARPGLKGAALKKSEKKLVLNRETVVNLRGVVGGTVADRVEGGYSDCVKCCPP